MSIEQVNTHTHKNWVKKYGWEGVLPTVVFMKNLNVNSRIWATSSVIVDPANPVAKLGLPNLSVHEVNFGDLQDGPTVVTNTWGRVITFGFESFQELHTFPVGKYWQKKERRTALCAHFCWRTSRSNFPWRRVQISCSWPWALLSSFSNLSVTL